MIRKVMLMVAGAIVLGGIAGCASDADKSPEDKKRDMNTQQPAPPPLPPSGHTPK